MTKVTVAVRNSINAGTNDNSSLRLSWQSVNWRNRILMVLNFEGEAAVTQCVQASVGLLHFVLLQCPSIV
jgi:hypothetical protein